jgi:DNA invertase Pin-like site-specific DNA recombinase
VRQRRSSFDLAAQRSAMVSYLNRCSWTILTGFVKIESGRRSDGSQLEKALDLCQRAEATLITAKLSRLARDAHLQKIEVDFIACDMHTENSLISVIKTLAAALGPLRGVKGFGLGRAR